MIIPWILLGTSLGLYLGVFLYGVKSTLEAFKDWPRLSIASLTLMTSLSGALFLWFLSG